MTTEPRPIGPALWVTLITLALAGPAWPADSYQEALEVSSGLAQQGKFQAAAQVLERIREAYPQDYQLRLELGWLAFQAGDWTAAKAHYLDAAELSPQALEPRLGLAWTQLRSGNPKGAHKSFLSIIQRVPDNASARQGLAQCEPASGLSISAAGALGVLTLSDNPDWSTGASISAGMGLTVLGAWAIGTTYRYNYFFRPEQSGRGGGPWAGFSQHEVYLATGYTGQRVGILGQYAFVQDGGGSSGQAHVMGLSGRISWQTVALRLAVSESLYPDRNVLRLAPSVDLSLGDHLVLEPTLALQHTGADWLPNAALKIVFLWDGGSAWLGGKFGDEERPAYLNQATIYNIEERIAWGAGLGVRFEIGRINLSLAWEISGLAPAQENSPAGLMNIVSLAIDHLPEERNSEWTP